MALILAALFAPAPAGGSTVEVAALQSALQGLRLCSGFVDGVKGPLTREGIRALQGPAADATSRGWITAMSGLLEPIATGHFISEADLIAHPGRLERCFLPAHWDRVQELRASRDPDGLFHGMPSALDVPLK